jgi:tetratricopeptide (TPR) repeat protein
MAGGAVNEDARYWAFISYSHKDAAFGRKLHKWLESYVLPQRLVGRETPRGRVPRRLAPIFRDREELPAAGNLSAEVRAALQVSRSLIVVCSPAAAASPWVAREVETFRALHPERHIFAAIVDGEPAECFPGALHAIGADGGRIEPLAADFRPHHDGSGLGLLKLVAGLAGVGLDELVQRDAQRKTRRVTAVTAAALAAVLVMGALTIFALNARTEAVRQRNEATHQHGKAEGLVDYMLTDLRDKLKGVGRLDIMAAVNERALHYYSDENLNGLPVDSLERRARILHAMGEDDETRGDLKAALAKFQEAHRTTAALLAQAPKDPERIFDHAQSEYWVALIAWRQYDFRAAEVGFEKYAMLANRLLAIDSKNPDWQMEAGYADSNLGTLLLRDKGDALNAQTHFKKALQHFQLAAKTAAKNRDLQSDIADGYAWLADSYRALGRFGEARIARAREAEIIHVLLRSDPKNAEYARDLLGNALGTAQIDMDEHQWGAATDRLTIVREDATRWAKTDPENTKLAKEKMAIGLFLARAKLHSDAQHVARFASLTRDCHSTLAAADQELRDFCAVISLQISEALGNPDTAAETYLRLNRDRMRKIRRSPRWGINFSDI